MECRKQSTLLLVFGMRGIISKWDKGVRGIGVLAWCSEMAVSNQGPDEMWVSQILFPSFISFIGHPGTA